MIVEAEPNCTLLIISKVKVPNDDWLGGLACRASTIISLSLNKINGLIISPAQLISAQCAAPSSIFPVAVARNGLSMRGAHAGIKLNHFMIFNTVYMIN